MKKPLMIKVIAIKNVRYNGILRSPGKESEAFEARPQDARILEALGKIKRVPVDATAKVAEVVSVTVHRTPKVQDPNKAGRLPSSEGEYMRRDVPGEALDQKGPKAEDKEQPKRSKYLKEDVKQELAKSGKTGE